MIVNVEHLDVLEGSSDELLSKALDLVLNPPVRALNLESAIKRHHYMELPQQRIEYIRVEDLQVILGENATIIFYILDQVISLLPYSTLKLLVEKRDIGMLRAHMDVMMRRVTGYKLKSYDMRSEDEVKDGILLLIPSWRQLDVVKGNWDRWVWRREAYDGSRAPDPLRLAKEIIGIGEVLRSEGIKVTLVVDNPAYHMLKGDIRGFNVITLDIPGGLAKIAYVRDQSVTWFREPIMGNMALDIRRGEVEVLNEIYYRLNIPPLARARWALVDGLLYRAYMEGGNFFVVKGDSDVVVLTGVGVRGSNWATFKFLGELLPDDVRILGVPLPGYIRDWTTGAVHLDVVFAYLGNINGPKVALIDPSRLGMYSILEYDRRTGYFKIIDLLRLARELDIIVDEPPRRGQSSITMVNMLNLGRGKVVVDSFNREVNEYLRREYGVDVIEVSIPQLEAGGGGVRCATRELWGV